MGRILPIFPLAQESLATPRPHLRSSTFCLSVPSSVLTMNIISPFMFLAALSGKVLSLVWHTFGDLLNLQKPFKHYHLLPSLPFPGMSCSCANILEMSQVKRSLLHSLFHFLLYPSIIVRLHLQIHSLPSFLLFIWINQWVFTVWQPITNIRHRDDSVPVPLIQRSLQIIQDDRQAGAELCQAKHSLS